jgi:hypothetical protein
VAAILTTIPISFYLVSSHFPLSPTLVHPAALDEADECVDEETTAPALDERAPTGGASGAVAKTKAKVSRPEPSEASNTVWIGR